MDESWRMKMGASGSCGGASSLEPNDFDDVFGGPPRSVLARKHSADFSGNDWFYNEIFKPAESLDSSAIVSGRRLPKFMIPEKKQRSKNKHSKSKSMSMSMSTSTSSCSSPFSIFDEIDELKSFHSATVIGNEDVAFSSFSSTLRPINVPSRWNSSSPEINVPSNYRNQDLPAFGSTKTAYTGNNKAITNVYNDYMMKNFNLGYSQTVTSPETINSEHIADEYATHLSLVSTVDSSLCRRFEGRTTVHEEDHSISSYVTEVNSGMTRTNDFESMNIDEAIAWAKEKFQGWSLNNNAVATSK